MANPVVHFELWSKDPAKCAAFYEKVFDWKIQHWPEMDYRMIEAAAPGIGGGIMKPQEGPWPGNMAFYVSVDDLAEHRKKVVDAGGKILVEEVPVPGMGSFALFADPEGRVLGLWKTTNPG